MKILITGGCGFLGSNLASTILKNSIDELFIFDNLSRDGSEKNLQWLRKKGGFKYYKNDINRALKKNNVSCCLYLVGKTI
jgi:CDP-paratose 2-epimerase